MNDEFFANSSKETSWTEDSSGYPVFTWSCSLGCARRSPCCVHHGNRTESSKSRTQRTVENGELRNRFGSPFHLAAIRTRRSSELDATLNKPALERCSGFELREFNCVAHDIALSERRAPVGCWSVWRLFLSSGYHANPRRHTNSKGKLRNSRTMHTNHANLLP